MTESKNSSILQDFVKFCKTHPELRFWQALSAWSEYHFIYASESAHALPYAILQHTNSRDTFYIEGRRHDDPRPTKTDVVKREDKEKCPPKKKHAGKKAGTRRSSSVSGRHSRASKRRRS